MYRELTPTGSAIDMGSTPDSAFLDAAGLDSDNDKDMPDASAPDMAPDPTPWWNDGYSHRARITLGGNGRNISDFRMRVVLTASSVHATFSRESVVFVSQDGNEYTHEYELNGAGEAQTFWVRGDFELGTDFWMYWGGDSDRSSAGKTWEDHVAVMHFASQAVAIAAVGSSLPESVQCMNCTTAAGLAGDSALVTSAGERAELIPEPVTDIRVNPGKSLTVRCCIVVINRRTDRMTLVDAMSDCVGWRAFVADQVVVEFGTRDNAGDCATISTRVATPYTPNEWHHLAFTIDRDTNTPSLMAWHDGVSIGSSAITSQAESNLSSKVVFGANRTGVESFDGLLDELRIWRGVAAPDEVVLERDNTKGAVAVVNLATVQSRVSF
ncbi:MAG: LamG domain-containing protein [bacterium]